MGFQKVLAVAVLYSTSVLAVDSACLPTLTGFVCKNEKQEVVTNRCATNRGCYELKEMDRPLQCCPVTSISDLAKKRLINLSKFSTSENLSLFKRACDFSSPIDFVADRESKEAVSEIFHHGNVNAIRGLVFSEDHCVNINSHERVLSMLGNEILMQHPRELLEAFYEENKREHLSEIASMQPNQWRGTECIKDSCKISRATYFSNKLTALENAKIGKQLEPLRKDVLIGLKSVTHAGKHSFLELLEHPSDQALQAFKERCSIANPVDFLHDEDVVPKFKQNLTNVYVIRSIIYAEPRCADIENRKAILRWLGNEILIQSPEHLISAMQFEDKKHELYDIAEVENVEWNGVECLGEPCIGNRKAFFATKRSALEKAKILVSQEPIRRMLLKYLKSDL